VLFCFVLRAPHLAASAAAAALLVMPMLFMLMPLLHV
jgi:hypothetical protein